MASEFLKKINLRLAKLSFSGGQRLDLYRSILMLLDNQVLLNEALKELHRVYSDEGKKKNDPIALVLEDCIDGMNNGMPFTMAFAKWAPSEEAMLLQAGETSGKLAGAFAEAEKIMRAKKEIIGSIIGAAAYPLVLFSLTGFLLNMIATDLVPKLAQVADPKKWEGAARILYHLAYFVEHYGLTTVVLLVASIIAIMSSLSWLGGPLRIVLDLFPPWSIYRMVQGATFMLNLSALIQSGMRLNVAMTQLAEQSSPWLRTRIEAALEEISVGKNLGEALSDSGYNFPDKRANRFLSVIAAYSGIDVALGKFGNSWLEDTVKRIQQISKLMLVFGVMAVGITMLMVIAGAGGIQDAVQSSVGN